jgi:hypothetical protein
LLAGIVIGSSLATASDRDDKADPVVLWAALQDASTTLEAGLVAGAQRGQPVSARFDIADGDLLLIVYTAVDDSLAQVIVHPNSGAILWSEPITASDDLADAAAQKAAMKKAKVSLLAAVQQALGDNRGARAVAVTPELQNSHPIAVITLLDDKRFLTVSRWLE